MNGKRCLVTGATAGIGEVAALELALQGYDVTIIGRNESRCKDTLSRMNAQGGGGDHHYLVADMSSRKQVVRVANEFKSRFDRLDVLVNNAGALFFNDERSEDNLEMTWALNHFGYFWLTNELLELLKKSAPSRVINVSSAAHKRARLNKTACIDQKNNLAYFTYGNTKLANLLFTYELARRLSADRVTVNAMHPGMVSTNFAINNGIPGRLFNLATSFISIPPKEGAKTIVYLASSEEVAGITGKYFFKEKVLVSSAVSRDEELAKHLWSQSEKVTSSLDGTPAMLGD